MTDTISTHCGYVGDREAALIGYLYDDGNAIERATFDAHLTSCERCRGELATLGGVRSRLSAWAPPALRSAGRESEVANRRWWREIPAWAQVAAALLFLGVAAGLANLDVRYNQDGLTVRTGWVKTVGAPAAAVRPAQDGAFGPPAPWRTDLAALEQQLRHEFHASEVSAASMPTTTRQAVSAPGMSDAELLRRVRLLIDESERRQQREIALRSAELLQDVKQQRYADMVKIDQSLGLVQSKTGMEVAKNRELLRYIVNASGQK